MDKERGLGELRLRIDDDAAAHLAKVSDGDARKCLNALEIAARTTPPDQSGLVHITLSAAEESIQRKAVVYDADGDAHYDTISAFIKSLRGSDPDAALYWLAKCFTRVRTFASSRDASSSAPAKTWAWPIRMLSL